MKRTITTSKIIGLAFITGVLFNINTSLGQCEVTVSADPIEIQCGESVDLSAFGQSDGDVVLSEDFNSGGFGPGWGSTPGATSFSNPCSPGGVDGTPHAWMDNNTSVPRTLQSASYDLTTATAGVTICFDLLFATQGNAAPCEGPDEPDEGVYLEYSTDGGATWQQIYYFDPNGGNDPDLTNWNNWCFQVPPGAITSNTIFRWFQSADSGADYDHWGIDNVEIYQNDVNAELEWLHDGYSYGVGNPGGVNPNSVSPTTTTTYTAQLTTGNGDVCSEDITIVVTPPIYDVNVSADPTTICDGDCSDITGDANWVLDPGGIETYENNQLEIVASGSASVNINIQDLNMSTVDPGSLLEICINDFNYSGSELCTNFGGCNCNGTPINFGDNCNIDASSFNITVTSPSGCQITLVPANEITTTGIQDMCFVPAGGDPISTGSGNYTGQFDPDEPISTFDGCDANGVWTLEFNTGSGGLGFGFGSLTGWNITFDDPPIYGPTNTTWSPGTGLSSTNTVNTQACPATTTTYTLEVDNGVPGCPTYTEDITIIVDPCNGCTPPVLNLDPLTVCAPNDADLNNAINATSDPANTTFHNTQADAQNDVNAIGNLVGTTGSYWVRAEDPTDPTCFEVYEIIVTVITVGYNVNITDENCGNLDGELDLTGSGGTAPYTYSIDNGATSQGTGLFSGLAAGSYDIVITDDNGCQVTGTEVINNVGGPTIDAINTVDPTCAGDCDGEISVTVSGGTAPYTYQWLDNVGNPIGIDDPTITGLCAGDYSIEVNDNSGACVTTDNATLTDPIPEDPSFTLTDFCENSPNSATITGDAGGTFAFNPAPGDGSSIDPATGEITDGVNGTTYTVEYTTGGACPETSTETVSVTGFGFNSNIVDENCGNLDGEIELIPNGGTAPYTYSIDNGATSQGTGTFSNVAAGVYNVVITDDNGCESTGTVNVNNIGGPSIDNLTPTDPTCNGACDGVITVAASGGTPPYSYQWYDDAGNPIGIDDPTITGLCAGDYSVEVTDAAGGSTVINTNTGFENGPGGGCDCADDYNCANDAGQVFDGNHPVYTVGDQGCVSSANNFTNSLGANNGTGYMYFYAGADQFSTGPFAFTGGETVELCIWYAGPQGAGASGQNTANSYFSFGVDGVQVGPDIPVPTNTGWTQVCFTVTMTAGNHTFEILSGGAAQYSIWFDDFTITDNSGGAGCPVTSATTLTDPVIDDASFTLTDFCEGSANSASGVATPGGTFAFNPAPGDGSTIDAGTGEITNGVGGTTYSVEYTTPGVCPETSIETVDVIAAPSFMLSQVNPGCGSTDGEIIISNLLPNTSYDVTYNDGAVVGPQNLTSDAAGEIIISNLPAGSYTDFELTLNGCTTIDNTIIDLIQAGAPSVTAPADLSVCIGEDVTLTAGNPDGATITWDNGVNDGVPFNPGAAGTTTYTVTADLNGCSITDEVDVTVNPLPVVDAGADQTICEGESITLSGTGAQNYVWDNGVVDGTSFTPGSTTTYNVVGTDANGCINTDQVTITVEPAPAPSFVGDELTGCSPHAVEFTNTTGAGTNCTWDFGDGVQVFGCGTVNHIYETPGLYTVTLTVENAAGCSGTTTLTNYIEVTSPPIASFTADPQVTDINNTEVNFTNTSVGGVDFEWDFGDNSPNAYTYDATHDFPNEEGDSYIVTLIASNGVDCADTARLVIKVDDVIIFYVPNTFTPDGDPHNQTFQPVFTSGYDPQDFHMMIFNRWGEVIFETYDASQGWDGNYGSFGYVKDGTYIWTIEFQETMSDKRHYHQGHVNILR